MGMSREIGKTGTLAGLSSAALISLLSLTSRAVLAQGEDEWIGGYDPFASVACCVITIIILIVIGVVIYMMYFA